jgi:hypothetical protein
MIKFVTVLNEFPPILYSHHFDPSEQIVINTVF